MRCKSIDPAFAASLIWATSSVTNTWDSLPDFVRGKYIPAEISLVCVLVPGKIFRLEYTKSMHRVRFSGGPGLPVQQIIFADGELLIKASSEVYSLTLRIAGKSFVIFGETGSRPQRAECVAERY